MKKLIAFLFLFTVSLHSFSFGLKPEEMIRDHVFSKNENGVVIFNSVSDLLEENGDYPKDSNRMEIISESPLKFRLSTVYFDGESDEFTQIEQYNALIYAVYQVFTHTKNNELEVTINSVNFDMKNPSNQKILKFRPMINLKINREEALSALKKVANINSFDELVVLTPKKEYHTIGYSISDKYTYITSDGIREKLAQFLLNKSK